MPKIDWEKTCEVKDLRISYLEQQLAEVTKDRDLYREKCLSFMFPTPNSNEATMGVTPQPILPQRRSLNSIRAELERKDRDLAKQLHDKKLEMEKAQ